MKNQVKSMFAIAAVVSVALSASYANAGNKGPNVDDDNKGSGTVSALSNTTLAANLIAYGDKNKDPMALILGAKIKKSNPIKDAERKKTSEGGEDNSGNKSADKGNSVDEVLARARKLSGKNKGLLAMADTVSSMKSRGYVRGPSRTRTKVRARSNDIFFLKFQGGKRAEVAVVGDGDTDLDLYVYDENGNRVCKDLGSSDRAYCRWYPRWTGKFKVKVKNRGRVYNRYTMLTN